MIQKVETSNKRQPFLNLWFHGHRKEHLKRLIITSIDQNTDWCTDSLRKTLDKKIKKLALNLNNENI